MNLSSVSGWLARVIMASMCLVPVVIILHYTTCFGYCGNGAVEWYQDAYVSSQWTTMGSSLLWVAGLVTCWLPFFCAVWIIRRILLRYQMGLVFDCVTGRLFRVLGVFLLCDGLFSRLLSRMFFRLAETIYLGAGHRVLEITFDSASIGAIFSGILVLILASVMMRAVRLSEEQSLTI